MKVCDVCNGPIETRVSSYEQLYHYSECGLPNVFLVGVKVYSCPKCEIEVADIPNMDGMHRALAKELLMKPAAMTGSELRFLRKETLLKPKDFAERVGVDPKTIANWEGSKMLNKQTDLAVRLVVAGLLLDGAELTKVLSQLSEITAVSNWDEIEQEIDRLAEENTILGISNSNWEFGPVEV